MRRFFLHRPVRTVALAALLAPVLSASALAAGSSAIDPDPRAPSLSELLQREEEARSRKAVAEPAPDVSAPVALPSGPALVPAPANANAGPKSVRQVYPSPYDQRAVTVLVPGGRLPPR
ncbi:MAG: hypothetical protein LCH39_03535 [Proteobacteria bacterium]|nr:hypothetical protein [Pseudomonadota bacterium]